MEEGLKEAVTHGSKEFHFAVYHICNTHYTLHTGLHWHDETEILYIERGTLSIYIGTEFYEGHAGDIFIINPREIHSMSFDDLNTSYAAVLFSGRSLIFLDMDVVNTRFLLPFIDGKLKLQTVVNSCTCYRQIRSDLQQIITLNETQSAAYQLGTKILLLDILYQMNLAQAVSLVPVQPEHSLHREILDYISHEFRHDLNLSQIAEQFHMSPKYFSRFFHHTFHLTLTQYINQLRMEHAASLLTGTTLSVTEIALQSGFSSCSYFNKKFQTAFHCSPNQYRKGQL